MIKNKEKSILEFQNRILDLVGIDDTPIMEKINFLRILVSNLLEFISIRMYKVSDENEENAEIEISNIFMRMGVYLEGMNDQYEIPEIDTSPDIYRVIPHKDFQNVYSCENDASKTKNLSEVSGVKRNPRAYSIIYSGNQPMDVYPIYAISCPKCIILVEEYYKIYKEKFKDAYYDTRSYYKKIENYYQFLKKQDFMIRNPYESYQYVLDFIDEMCSHPNVETIFITLYRLAKNSKIIDTLIKAKRLNKNVFVYVEPSARGDEDSNLKHMRRLTKAGIVVNTSYFKYKVHCKIFCAIDIYGKVYTHVGTGNYNEDTAKHYTDCHLLTTNPDITNDVLNNMLCIFRKEMNFQSIHGHVISAPIQLRLKLIRMIREEAAKGENGFILIKCNNIHDQEMIDEINNAAEKGVVIRIICRTACGLLPHDNMVIRSKVGQYLEHERIYVFGDRAFIASADLLTRNLSKRVEIMCEIQSYKIKLISIFNHVWNSKHIHQLQVDGSWELV